MKIWGFLVVGLLLIGAGVAAYFALRPSPTKPTPEVAVPIEPAPVLRKVKKTMTPVKRVETYDDSAKATLKLPAAVIAAPEEKIIAAAVAASSDHPQTITTTLNTDTGKVETFIKEEPLPWLAFNQRGSAGIYTGYKLDRVTGTPQRATRLTVQHDFMQTKAVNFGVQASIDSDGSTFAGVGMAYRW